MKDMAMNREYYQTFREAVIRKNELSQGRENNTVKPIAHEDDHYVVIWETDK